MLGANSSAPIRSSADLGTAIRNHRKALGLTQVEVAELTGLRQATISSLERGTAQLSTVWVVLSALSLELTARKRTVGTAADFESLF